MATLFKKGRGFVVFHGAFTHRYHIKAESPLHPPFRHEIVLGRRQVGLQLMCERQHQYKINVIRVGFGCNEAAIYQEKSGKSGRLRLSDEREEFLEQLWPLVADLE